MLALKPDYEQSKQRIDAFWERELIDRPVVQFGLAKPAEKRVPLPLSQHATSAERWLDAPYQAGSRVGFMYKLKPIMETLDLVVTGATWGEGRRASWIGSYLLSVYDPHSGDFLEIGRMATGVSDKQLEELTEILKPLITSESGKEVKVKPQVVMEVAYEEIQKSPTYASGYALRFPRLVRVREDKGPVDADTLDRVEAML